MAEYLERESILNAIRKTSNLYVDQQGLYLSCELIAAMPATDVQPVRHGRWIRTDKSIGVETVYACSECGYLVRESDRTNYCGDCGSKMDGEQK